MTKGFYNLTSAMLTQGRRLDVISNNMANIATPGYKADQFIATTFQEEMWKRVGNKNKEEYTELGQQSFITAPANLSIDYSQGMFEETGQALDFAIDGDGFFAVQTPDGRALTRNGSFSLDLEGYLYLPGQGRVLGVNGSPIQLVTDKIHADGAGALYSENGTFLGRIGVFTVDNPQDTLERNDYGLFTGSNGTAQTVTIHQGMLERSNADIIKQLVEMISAERAYQSAAEVIKIYDQVLSHATTDVGRLS